MTTESIDKFKEQFVNLLNEAYEEVDIESVYGVIAIEAAFLKTIILRNKVAISDKLVAELKIKREAEAADRKKQDDDDSIPF